MEYANGGRRATPVVAVAACARRHTAVGVQRKAAGVVADYNAVRTLVAGSWWGGTWMGSVLRSGGKPRHDNWDVVPLARYAAGRSCPPTG